MLNYDYALGGIPNDIWHHEKRFSHHFFDLNLAALGSISILDEIV